MDVCPEVSNTSDKYNKFKVVDCNYSTPISHLVTLIINVEEFLLSHSSVVSTDSRWRRGCTSDGREMTVRFYYFYITVRISKICFLGL